MDELLKRPRRRHVSEVPIAPILDMLVAVIFFLLLSTSFIEYTQQPLPPTAPASASGSAASAAPARETPLSPKLAVARHGSHLIARLTWVGDSPGSAQVVVPAGESAERFQPLDTLIARFRARYSDAAVMPTAFGPDIGYQDVVRVIDVVRSHRAEIALLAYDDEGLRLLTAGGGVDAR